MSRCAAAVRTVSREAEKKKLQRAHEFSGVDTAALEAQQRSRRPARPTPVAEDQFAEIMKEIEERHTFLEQMRQLGKAQAYEATIKREIEERLNKLKAIDKQRSAS